MTLFCGIVLPWACVGDGARLLQQGWKLKGPGQQISSRYLGGRLRESYMLKPCVTVPGLHFFLWQLSSNSPGSHIPMLLFFSIPLPWSACTGPSTRLLGECLQAGAALPAETVPAMPLGQTTMRTIPLDTCRESAWFLLR